MGVGRILSSTLLTGIAAASLTACVESAEPLGVRLEESVENTDELKRATGLDPSGVQLAFTRIDPSGETTTQIIFDPKLADPAQVKRAPRHICETFNRSYVAHEITPWTGNPEFAGHSNLVIACRA